jgi:hypothetical protein
MAQRNNTTELTELLLKCMSGMCQVNVGKFHNKGNCSEKLAEINDVNK